MPYTDTTVSNFIINVLTKNEYDSITTPSESELYLITDDSNISAGSGISVSTVNGVSTVNHSNSVTAQTTQAVYPIKIDAQGHISTYGSAVTIPTKTSDLNNDSGFISAADIPVADVKVNGTSVVDDGEVNLLTNTAYNASSNKIATMSDLSSLEIAYKGTMTLSGTTATLSGIAVNKIVSTIQNIGGTGKNIVYVYNNSGNRELYYLTDFDYESGEYNFTFTCYNTRKLKSVHTTNYSASSTSTSMTGTYSEVAIPSTSLPSVTSSDNGKVLMVVNGAWAAATLTQANGNSF